MIELTSSGEEGNKARPSIIVIKIDHPSSSCLLFGDEATQCIVSLEEASHFPSSSFPHQLQSRPSQLVNSVSLHSSIDYPSDSLSGGSSADDQVLENDSHSRCYPADWIRTIERTSEQYYWAEHARWYCSLGWISIQSSIVMLTFSSPLDDVPERSQLDTIPSMKTPSTELNETFSSVPVRRVTPRSVTVTHERRRFACVKVISSCRRFTRLLFD